MGFTVENHPGLSVIQAVTGRSPDYLNVIETGADGGNQSLFAEAHPVDQQKPETRALGGTSVSLFQSRPQISNMFANFTKTELVEVGDRLGHNGEVVCQKTERNDAAVAYSLGSELTDSRTPKDWHSRKVGSHGDSKLVWIVIGGKEDNNGG
jgi:hypothetical protein